MGVRDRPLLRGPLGLHCLARARRGQAQVQGVVAKQAVPSLPLRTCTGDLRHHPLGCHRALLMCVFLPSWSQRVRALDRDTEIFFHVLGVFFSGLNVVAMLLMLIWFSLDYSACVGDAALHRKT